ncbi:hypothetical protein QCA50_009555 [Cerrena zonata]|uniref:Peptidase A1 domain-containing protein n=1 Tax=Cerrena zonata TaxID=2478898 RepID=A0AAW0GDB6_9APHY
MMLSLFSWVVLALYANAATVEVRKAQPVTIPLSSRKIAPGEGVQRRALAAANLGLKDYFNGTDLHCIHADQKSSIDGKLIEPNAVGTPPQTLSVVFDTGSTSLEFASTLCGATCSRQKKFDSTKSSTFTDGGRTQSITFGTGVGVDPVIGNNWQLSLRSATDVVSIAGLNAGRVSLFLITNQTPTFSPEPFDGIQGMGPRLTGTFAGLANQGLPALFSMLLTPNSVGGAELTLGGIDSTKFQGNLVYADNEESSFWGLTSSAITVNGKTSTTLRQSREYLPDTKAVYALISPNIKANAAEPGTFGIPCSQVSTLPAVISFTFTSQSGQSFDLTIPSSELSVGPFRSNPTLCQTLINADDSFNIIGASLLKHYYSVWDIGNQRMGFAPNVH